MPHSIRPLLEYAREPGSQQLVVQLLDGCPKTNVCARERNKNGDFSPLLDRFGDRAHPVCFQG
jgi:hypothetical protein